MPPDPYRNLAEILEGTVSLMSYYARRMEQAPLSLESTKAALRETIRELHSRAESEQPAD